MTEYTVVRVYTSEKARYEGKELAPAIEAYIRSLKIAARCVIMRGSSGCYENGETATTHIVELSYNLPLIIEIVVPSADAPAILERLGVMVVDGLVSVIPATVTSFRSAAALFPKNLRVADVMTANPMVVRPDLSVHAAVELLVDMQLKALPVVDADRKCVGIITPNDLVSRARMPIRLGLLSLLPPQEWESWFDGAEALRCDRVMTKNPDTVEENARLSEAIHFMNHRRRKRLPVLDAQGFLVGMLSRIDVLKAIAATRESTAASAAPAIDGSAPHFVRDIEARDAFSLREDASIKAAIDGLVAHGLQRAAIVDKDGTLVGLVSDELLVRAIGGGALRHAPFGGIRRTRLYARPISSIMKKDIKSVGEDVPIDEAIRLMTEFGFKRVPVVGSDGKYRGMIRRDSILSALAHTI